MILLPSLSELFVISRRLEQQAPFSVTETFPWTYFLKEVEIVE